MAEFQLDDIDKKIIKILHRNSRTTIAEIAREIDELTENAVRYRIDKLESEGYISNYTIRLDPKKFGKNVMALFYLNVLPDRINGSIEYIKSFSFITDVYLITGKFSIIAIGYFDDREALTKFITENLKRIKMVDYDVITVLQRVKRELYSI